MLIYAVFHAASILVRRHWCERPIAAHFPRPIAAQNRKRPSKLLYFYSRKLAEYKPYTIIFGDFSVFLMIFCVYQKSAYFLWYLFWLLKLIFFIFTRLFETAKI
jgi:hypothetical protein